jgi:DNA-binding response OmpR family regulator
MSRVLVVDDDVDILEGLAIVLQDRHQISTAANGLEALRLLKEQTFDAMVLDLMMPLMDGETLIEKMRDSGIAVPVVLASASSDITTLAVRLNVEYVSKPYDIAVLEEKIARLIAGSGSGGDTA